MATAEDISGYDGPTEQEAGSPPSRGAAQVPPVAVPELKSLLAIAVGAVVIAALYFGKDVLVPITLAVMLSFVLSPIVVLLQRLRLWRAPAVILTVLAAFGLIGLVGTLIGTQAASLASDAPRYAATIETKVQTVQRFAVTRMSALTKMVGGAKPQARPGSLSPAAPVRPGAARPAQRQPVLVEMASDRNTPFSVAKAIIEPILGPLETTLIVVIVAIFFLLQREDLRDRFIRLFGSSDLHRTTLALDDAGKRLSHYFLSQLSVNAGFGLVVGLGLWLIGIPSPAMWGILAGLLRFVPYIGSTLAAVAPVALAAAIAPGWALAIYTGVLFVVVELLTGYVVEPMLYGHSTGLSPVSVIVAAIFWTWLWGPIGLILSTPLTLCLVVMGRHVKSLEFFDVLLGDRPALTPVESFYQRILSNDPDEALVQAETLLADRPLLDYYDDVAVEGLKLAAEDEARGTIDQARIADMARAVATVVEELHDHVDAEDEDDDADRVPAPAAIGRTVACVAGQGAFDAAANRMLGQLFGQRGWGVRLLPNSAVARDAIAGIDLTGIDVVVVTTLSRTGSQARLRYLVKRLRQRDPAIRIVVGLWPDEGDGGNDTRQMIRADAYGANFREMLAGAAE